MKQTNASNTLWKSTFCIYIYKHMFHIYIYIYDHIHVHIYIYNQVWPGPQIGPWLCAILVDLDNWLDAAYIYFYTDSPLEYLILYI